MTKEETKNLIVVLQAFSEGKAIECQSIKSEDKSIWVQTSNPSWNTEAYRYRIKPKEVVNNIVPFTSKDYKLFVGIPVLSKKYLDSKFIVTKWNMKGIYDDDDDFLSYEDALKNLIFEETNKVFGKRNQDIVGCVDQKCAKDFDIPKVDTLYMPGKVSIYNTKIKWNQQTY